MQSPSTPEYVIDKQGNKHEVVDFNNDYTASKLGFWLFLSTELIIFGTLFMIYAFYFFLNPVEFVSASTKITITLGAVNTFILLISALTMGLSVLKLRQGDKKCSMTYIWITLALSVIFLIIKYFEWSGKIAHGLFPNMQEMLALPRGEQIFFGLYYSITGLHGIHIIFGIGAMLWVIYLICKDTVNKENFVVLENVALYWDFVHLAWVFVFPLFYIIHQF